MTTPTNNDSSLLKTGQAKPVAKNLSPNGSKTAKIIYQGMKMNTLNLLSIFVFAPFLSLHISDGDTLNFNHQRIRLACIDAPESDQPWGSQSTQRLRELLGNGSQLQVQIVDIDRYGRSIGKLYVGKVYVQEQLLREGLAWVYPRYLHNCPTTAQQLLEAQEEAQVFRRGIWSSDESIAPWEWRQR